MTLTAERPRTKKAQAEFEKAESLGILRKWIKPGTTVYTVLRHVSSSGMSRRISLYVLIGNEPRYLDYHVGKVLDYKRHPRHDGLTVGGCGMDMGYHLVHSLGYALWGQVGRRGSNPA